MRYTVHCNGHCTNNGYCGGYHGAPCSGYCTDMSFQCATKCVFRTSSQRHVFPEATAVVTSVCCVVACSSRGHYTVYRKGYWKDMSIKGLLQCIVQRLVHRHVYPVVTAMRTAPAIAETCLCGGHCNVSCKGHWRDMCIQGSLRCVFQRSLQEHVFSVVAAQCN